MVDSGTANGETFNPNGLTAAHKYLPLPTHVKVTNLENGRSIIDYNPKSGERIIDLSAGAAKKLGFYEKGSGQGEFQFNVLTNQPIM